MFLFQACSVPSPVFFGVDSRLPFFTAASLSVRPGFSRISSCLDDICLRRVCIDRPCEIHFLQSGHFALSPFADDCSSFLEDNYQFRLGIPQRMTKPRLRVLLALIVSPFAFGNCQLGRHPEETESRRPTDSRTIQPSPIPRPAPPPSFRNTIMTS